jgi:homoserine dehydrogenase
MPPIPVAVVGVGLVGSEFLSQLLSLRPPSPFKLVAIASSKKLLYCPSGLVFSQSGWKSDLANSNTPLDIKHLVAELSKAKENDGKSILVDNTSSDTVASLYPEILRSCLSIVTPNKKAFSGDLSLFSDIVSASQTLAVKYLNESTVGAGLPIISTLKEMVATGDEVCPDIQPLFRTLTRAGR